MQSDTVVSYLLGGKDRSIKILRSTLSTGAIGSGFFSYKLLEELLCRFTYKKLSLLLDTEGLGFVNSYPSKSIKELLLGTTIDW
jgi:hypothetical protein